MPLTVWSDTAPVMARGVLLDTRRDIVRSRATPQSQVIQYHT